MTEPLLRIFYPDRIVQREIAAAERAELGEVDAFTVLVAVPADAAADDSARLAALGDDLLGRERPGQVVLAKLLPQPVVPLELASGFGADLGTIAAAGDGLRTLARDLQADGVGCSVIVRFSADPAADLTRLTRTVAADVVLVTDPEAGVEEPVATGGSLATLAPPAVLPDVGEAALAIVRLPAGAGAPPGPEQVAVLVDGGADGRSALRLGAHIALRRGGALAVGSTADRRSGRRAAAAVQALNRHGVEAGDLADGASAAVVLLPDGTAVPAALDGATVVRVRSAVADADEDLDQVVARIAVSG